MPLTGEGLTRSLYVRTLAVLYPLLSSWETWSSQEAPESLQPLLAARRRSHLLLEDLRFFGAQAQPGTVAPVAWEAVVGGPEGLRRADPGFQAAFLGALYVLEGSTLGGRFIARHVESVLGLAPGAGDSYFQGHGEATGSLWREVTAEIAAVPEELSPVVTEAARRSFRAFGDALVAGELASITVHG